MADWATPRAINENVINQGLFHLDWRLDHRAEVELLIMRLNAEAADQINWSNPHLVCMAGDFARYDELKGGPSYS